MELKYIKYFLQPDHRYTYRQLLFFVEEFVAILYDLNGMLTELFTLMPLQLNIQEVKQFSNIELLELN
jgi:hypothetical protein